MVGWKVDKWGQEVRWYLGWRMDLWGGIEGEIEGREWIGIDFENNFCSFCFV